MCHDAQEYEFRAAECERLAHATSDPVLREEILSLSRIYRGFAEHLRSRLFGDEPPDWKKAVND